MHSIIHSPALTKRCRVRVHASADLVWCAQDAGNYSSFDDTCYTSRTGGKSQRCAVHSPVTYTHTHTHARAWLPLPNPPNITFWNPKVLNYDSDIIKAVRVFCR